jgi:hypothetical protein
MRSRCAGTSGRYSGSWKPAASRFWSRRTGSLGQRFVDKIAAEARERLAKEILSLRGKAKASRKSSTELIRALRGSLP